MAGNRYYIPPRHDFMDLAQLGLQLYGMKQRGAEAKERQTLSEKEHLLQERTQKTRERESIGEWGGRVPAGTYRGGGSKTIKSNRQLSYELAKRRFAELQEMNQLMKAKAPLTDKPATVKEMAIVKSRLAYFDKSNKVDIRKIIAPQMNWVDQNYEQTPKYELFKRLQGMLKTDEPRIVREIQDEIDKLIIGDPKIEILAQQKEDIVKGKWLERIMPNCAERQMLERQSRETAKDLTTAQKLAAEARRDTAAATLIKAERGPEGRAMKTYITSDNRIITIPNNQRPPEGSVPYSTGMDLEVGPEGTVSLRTGISRRRGQEGMTRTTQTALEKGVLDTSAGIERLNQITKSYRPEFLELGTKWKAFKTKWGEKLKGIPFTQWLSQGISSKERKLLADFATFRREAIDNINRYIKEITGAQMSEAEANRLRKAVPDPGEGFFDGDSPTEFQAKWKSGMDTLKLSQARFMYLKNTGMTPESIQAMARNDTLPSLPQIRNIMEKRTNEILIEVKQSNPNITLDALRKAVAQRIKQEFGI